MLMLKLMLLRSVVINYLVRGRNLARSPIRFPLPLLFPAPTRAQGHKGSQQGNQTTISWPVMLIQLSHCHQSHRSNCSTSPGRLECWSSRTPNRSLCLTLDASFLGSRKRIGGPARTAVPQYRGFSPRLPYIHRQKRLTPVPAGDSHDRCETKPSRTFTLRRSSQQGQ